MFTCNVKTVAKDGLIKSYLVAPETFLQDNGSSNILKKLEEET